jgi:hypothetical protein
MAANVQDIPNSKRGRRTERSVLEEGSIPDDLKIWHVLSHDPDLGFSYAISG